MAKKNETVDTQEIAEKILEKETAKNEPTVLTVCLPITSVNTLRPIYGWADTCFGVSQGITRYPPNRTDQLHRATIGDMIRQGQGEVKEDDLNNFDYPVHVVDGKPVATPDRGEKGHGLYDLEWADPAQRYESERRVHTEIVTAIRREAADRAQAMAAERARAQSQAQSQAQSNGTDGSKVV